MEMQENESNGFVKFTNNRKNDAPAFPEHFKQRLAQLDKERKEEEKPKERSSAEIAKSADRMRAELAEIQAKREALLNKKRGSGLGK